MITFITIVLTLAFWIAGIYCWGWLNRSEMAFKLLIASGVFAMLTPLSIFVGV